MTIIDNGDIEKTDKKAAENGKSNHLKNEVDGLLKSVFTEFCNSTSAHGFHKLAPKKDKEESSYGRLIWLTLIFSAFVGFGIHLSLLVVRYLHFPTNTEILESSIPFKFPDVTFCPNARYAWNKLDTNHAMSVVAGTNHTLNQGFNSAAYRFWWSVFADNAEEQANSIMYTRMSHREIIPVTSAYREPHDVIFGCQYRGQDCSFLNFTTIWHPVYYLCFTFKPNEREIKSPGFEGGLQLYLGSWDLGFYQTAMERADYIRGHRIVVHPKDTTPNFDSNSVMASTGDYLEVQLELTDTNSLNRPLSPCIESDQTHSYYVPSGDQQNITETHVYSPNDCKITQTQELFLKECGCLSEAYRVPYELRNYTGCHKLPLQYYNNGIQPWFYNSTYKIYQFMSSRVVAPDGTITKEYFSNITEPAIVSQASCEHALRNRLLRERKKFQCKNSCHYSTYTKTVERKTWPQSSTYARPFLDTSVKTTTDLANQHGLFNYSGSYYFTTGRKYTVASTFSKVVIYAGNSEGILRNEQYVYPLTNLFSDLMGILGFWAGTSVITLCELVEVVVSIVKRSMERKKKKNQVTQLTVKEKNDNENNCTTTNFDRELTEFAKELEN